MRVRDHPLIKYNDFHVAFRDTDIHQIEAMRALPGLVKQRRIFGAGMDDVLTDETVEHIINHSVSEGNYDDAPFSRLLKNPLLRRGRIGFDRSTDR